MPDREGSTTPSLIRALGLREGIAIHMGVIIGSGIFIVPATISGHVPAMGPMILVWVVAGFLTLFGALSLAELSSVLPQAGGPYVYLRHSFGRVWGFLFSWNDFFINKAGSAAAVAVGFATFMGYFFPTLSPAHPLVTFPLSFLGISYDIRIGGIQVVAIGLIIIVTLVNIRGVKLGGRVMTVFTTAKIIALLGLIAVAFTSGVGSDLHFDPWWPDEWTASLTTGFGLAMISALWAYDGWIDVTLNAGEFTNPRRNVPLSLVIGTIAVIVLYITANFAFAYVIPLHAMQGSSRIAADVARTAVGPLGGGLIVVGILCSTFGTTNGMLLSGPRSIFAAAVDGSAHPRFASVHPKHRSPSNAVMFLGCWSSLLTLSGTYEQITSYVVFGSWFFYGMTAVAVIVLRRKLPEADRPYKAWGYPYLTLLFVVLVGWFLYNTLTESVRDSLIGIVLLAAGFPLYILWRRKNDDVKDPSS